MKSDVCAENGKLLALCCSDSKIVQASEQLSVQIKAKKRSCVFYDSEFPTQWHLKREREVIKANPSEKSGER